MDGASEASKAKKKVKPGSFQGLGLSQATYKAVMKMGYKVPTPIQRKTIPTILEGQDVVAMARTGSGKTAAFLIPICEQLQVHSVSVGFRAVVLSPTRELAMQTAKFFRQLSRFNGLRCCLLVGGQAMEKQFEHLANNPDVVIATPGRLMHHILEAELSLSRVEILVFDEADRLFELGFAEQLQKILDATPISRQCLLFSATMPAQLVAFSRAGVKNPVFVRLDVETTLSESLDLWYLYVRKEEKLAAAVSVLRRLHKDKKSTIMFVATRHHVEFFGELLGQLGISAAVVYGSMDQVARTEQVARFRRHQAGILVTTDVAARGIDIPFLDHVLNFDFPPSAKLFVHRSGRTARVGRSGICASLVTIDDLPYTVELMLFLGHKFSVADGSADAPVAGRPVIGALPSLEHEVEVIAALLEEEGTILHSLHKSMLASYNLYNKTRPSASKQSVTRAKKMLEECGGATQLQCLVHPAFQAAKTQRREAAGGAVAIDRSSALLQELRGFRPRAEKVGSAISPAAMRLMEQAKLDASAVAAAREPEAGSKGGEPRAQPAADARSRPSPAAEAEGAAAAAAAPRDRPRVSKRRRLQLARGGTCRAASGGPPVEEGVFDGWEVQVDGLAPGVSSRAAGASLGSAQVAAAPAAAAQHFYLSTARSPVADAKERGLEMEQYQLDLLPDDSGDIQRAKSVMRWDAKKKKYLPVMVSADGRVVKRQQRRNESGQKVKGEAEKTNIYRKWARATKRRIQKVGELEQVTAYPLGKLQPIIEAAKTVEFSGDGTRSDHSAVEDRASRRKPVVPFHGQIEEKYLTHKQKRIIKKRRRKDSVVQGAAKPEVRTPQQMQRQKKLKERNMLKQNPKLRKKKAKEWKEKHRKNLEERQMKYGARTKAKMLIFDGPKKWKRRSGEKRRFGGI